MSLFQVTLDEDCVQNVVTGWLVRTMMYVRRTDAVTLFLGGLATGTRYKDVFIVAE